MISRSLDAEKKEFLSILSHELRNPLAALLSSVELLRLQEVYPPGTALLLETIEERVRAMTGMLNNLLDLSRAPHNTPARAPTPKLPLLPLASPAKHTKDAHTILVVDDNELAAEALGRILELRGHQVDVVYTGCEAVEKARELRPQIIILDIGLPDIDGYEVARILRKEKKYSPTLVALSGYGEPKDKQRAHKAGFDIHYTKPVGFEEIEDAFKKIPRMPKRRAAAL